MELFKPRQSLRLHGDPRKYWIALQPRSRGRLVVHHPRLARARTTAPTSRAAPRSRSRSRSPSTAGEVRAGRHEVGLRCARRRVGRRSGEPEPLPHPRAGDLSTVDETEERARPRGALLRRRRATAPRATLPAGRPRDRGEVQPRRRQDLRPLRQRARPRGDQARSSHGVAGVELRAGATQPAGRERARSQGRDPAQSEGRPAHGRPPHASSAPTSFPRTRSASSGSARRPASSSATRAVKSVAIAIVFIMAYLAFRFDLRFAPGGIVALVHDAHRRPRRVRHHAQGDHALDDRRRAHHRRLLDQRHRRRLRPHPREPRQAPRQDVRATIINLSRLRDARRAPSSPRARRCSRVLAFFIWGTGVIKDFAFALLVGIVAGTYSSIYVAAPLTEWIDRRFFSGSVAGPGKPSAPRTIDRQEGDRRRLSLSRAPFARGKPRSYERSVLCRRDRRAGSPRPVLR